jgi:hypothetical protein
MRGKDGKEDVHEWGGKKVYETPFNAVSKTEADLLVTWWENMTTITFTPDLQGAPGTTLEVKIAEEVRPMQMWGGDWDTLFAGMLTLYQISSVSFSSSSQSISASKSCSSFIASSSCSTGSSLSCSVFLVSVSDSQSCASAIVQDSWSASASVSRSCSVSGSSSVCTDLSSTSRSYSGSLSSSCGIIGVSFTSQSCSNDPAGDISCSESEAGKSCSESGAG